MTPQTIAIACGCMFLMDVMACIKSICTNRGRSHLAGFFDGNVGLLTNIYTIVGAGSIIKYGWHLSSIVFLVLLYVTDFCGTEVGTRLGADIKGNRR